MRRVACLFVLIFGGCLSPGSSTPVPTEGTRTSADAVVVAVVDSRITPYHLDWRASMMPQHRDDDPANDIPLEASPDQWLHGFPLPSSFASYSMMNITLPDDPAADVDPLIDRDRDQWKSLRTSTVDEIHYYVIPGTKIVGFLDFDAKRPADQLPVRDAAGHGSRASSVAVGNIYGACPECLLVFVNSDYTDAPLAWALAQPWIDVVTTSLVLGNPPGGPYEGANLGIQYEASERGQTLFVAAGNGVDGMYGAPTWTHENAMAGPDWVVTVGAVEPETNSSYSGAGKPVDVAMIGLEYPSQGPGNISSAGTMGGTSVATPVIAGIYARALQDVRLLLAGESRIQEDGVIAVGSPTLCLEGEVSCMLEDGRLTSRELRDALFGAAVPTTGVAATTALPPVDFSTEEERLMSQGYGIFTGRYHGEGTLVAEVERIVAIIQGKGSEVRPVGERDWMIVDSYCRQQRWGHWSDGAYEEGTRLPQPSPLWPIRSALVARCASTGPQRAELTSDGNPLLQVRSEI